MFSWDEQYRVGVVMIDAQHKHLFELCGKLHEEMSAGRGRESLVPILSDLIAYTRTHFSAEEKLMAENQFPGLDNHKTEHEALTRRVREFQRGYVEGKIALSVQLFRFLKAWLVDHIGRQDQEVAAWLRRRAAA